MLPELLTFSLNTGNEVWLLETLPVTARIFLAATRVDTSPSLRYIGGRGAGGILK